MLELYFRPMACSLAVRIALYEAGLEARYTEVDLVTKRLAGSEADFLSISAQGKVPVLVLDDDTRLTENAAVLQYVADLKPENGLAPAAGDPLRYRLLEWLSFIGTELHKAGLYVLFSPEASEAAKPFARQRLEKALPIVSTHLADRPYLVGDRFTVADGYLVWALLLIRHAGLTLDKVLETYLARMLERPALRRAVGEESRKAAA